MTLAEANHHSPPRRPKAARAREEEHELHHTAMVWTTPLPQLELFDVSEEEPSGARPEALVELRPQVWVAAPRRLASDFLPLAGP